MYEYISGVLVRKAPNQAVVDVQGIGYLIEISVNSFETLPQINEQCRLFTYLYVREDSQRLYGFATENERDLFLNLTSVSGIGPKVAIGILSGGSVDDVRQRILDEDVTALKRYPGIGPKTAKRIILELRETLTPAEGETGAAASPEVQQNQEAILALESLGYSKTQSEKAIRDALKENDAFDNVEDLIKNALKAI